MPVLLRSANEIVLVPVLVQKILLSAGSIAIPCGSFTVALPGAQVLRFRAVQVRLADRPRVVLSAQLVNPEDLVGCGVDRDCGRNVYQRGVAERQVAATGTVEAGLRNRVGDRVNPVDLVGGRIDRYAVRGADSRAASC